MGWATSRNTVAGALLGLAVTVLIAAGVTWWVSSRLPTEPPRDDDPESPWQATLDTSELGGLDEA
jgi:hypothetical protein